MLFRPFREKSFAVSGFLILAAVILLGLFWTGESPLEERVITLRYFLFAISGFVAFATPYLLFPDRNAALLQLGNFHGNDLIRYLISKPGFFFAPLFLLTGVMVFADIEQPFHYLAVKSGSFISALFFLTGLILVAMNRYAKSGLDSQFWKESEKGRRLRKQAADYLKYPLDPGSIPSLINTVYIFSLGAAGVVLIAAAGESFGMVYEIIIAFLMLVFGLVNLKKFRYQSDRKFYATNSFYSEFFGETLKGEDTAAQRKTEQLWWVPAKLKTHVWQFLLQTDRIIPAGRVVAAGHLLVWFIAYQKPDPQFITAVWIIFALAHHFFISLTLRGEVAPGWLLNWLDSKPVWLFSRFWMQLRWMVPLFISMTLQYFLFGTPDWTGQAAVFVLYISTAFTVSALGLKQLHKDFKT